mmetsp:Transcript_11885/g.16635  ORF Transcript_11885/g.16635 Transcript_11885/m.16635 type:complete len:354 (-) Transcript_11885:1329-2390(-)
MASDLEETDKRTLVENEETNSRPSNETLLSTAFMSFMGFTICQTIAAVVAGSEAMMGDSAAMFVDALTYLFNWIAERRKNGFDEIWEQEHQADDEVNIEKQKLERERAKRKMVLKMELIPPLVSVTTLVGVTIMVSKQAIRVIILDVHRDESEQANPNVNLMLIFSSMNLGLDVLNVFCFAKANHALGYETSHEHSKERGQKNQYEGLGTSDDEDSYDDGYEEPDHDSDAGYGEISTDDEELKGIVNGHNDIILDNDEGPNLNMCSAYTHVFADTLRSIAVIIAAIIAEVVDEVTSEEADATAAVVVSALILVSLIPLVHGLVKTFGELKAMRAEDAMENDFPEKIERSVELT